MTKKHHLTSSCLFEHHLQWIACHRSRESPVEEICGNFLSEAPSFESDASVVLTTVNVENWELGRGMLGHSLGVDSSSFANAETSSFANEYSSNFENVGTLHCANDDSSIFASDYQ